jgi:hypothetical protein
MIERKMIRTTFLVSAAFILMLAPTFATAAASSASTPETVHVHGIWALTQFNSTVLKTIGNIQYGAGSGTGPITGGMKGFNAATLLTRYNMKTQVIQFTGQIFCKCKIDGLTGQIWISVTHGIDRNASDPNGKTTGDLTVVGASGELKGTTGQGSFVTTTSSADMNYTMTLNVP